MSISRRNLFVHLGADLEMHPPDQALGPHAASSALSNERRTAHRIKEPPDKGVRPHLPVRLAFCHHRGHLKGPYQQPVIQLHSFAAVGSDVHVFKEVRKLIVSDNLIHTLGRLWQTRNIRAALLLSATDHHPTIKR